MERTAVLVGRQGPRAGVSSMMGAPLALRSRRSALALQLRSGRRLGRGCQGKLVTRASLFGVGTPEVLVIGVVALLVFGPKGLADAAKGLGKTLRTFQPTIQELKEVSEEFKSTLEDEIGLDEFKNSIQSPPSRPYTAKSEAAEPDLDEMRKASAAAAWGEQEEGAGKGGEGQTTFEETLSAPAEAAPKEDTPSDLSNLSLEELQAELERRKSE